MRYGRWILILALAASSAHGAGIGVRAGTTGLGADFGWGIAPTLGGRIGLSGLNFDTDFDTGGVSYDAKAKLANLNLLLDWSPLGPFRITGGFIANNNKIDLNGQPGSGASVPPGSSLTGTVTPDNDFAPVSRGRLRQRVDQGRQLLLRPRHHVPGLAPGEPEPELRNGLARAVRGGPEPARGRAAAVGQSGQIQVFPGAQPIGVTIGF